MRLFLMLLVITLSCGMAMAQSKQKKKKNKKQETTNSRNANPGPTSYSPYSPNENNTTLLNNKQRKSQKGKKNPSLNQTFDAKVEEFQKRLVANAKKYKKMEKEMQKPQYSDPSYFGHKTKPKIRKVGKRKFCKECGIVH